MHNLLFLLLPYSFLILCCDGCPPKNDQHALDAAIVNTNNGLVSGQVIYPNGTNKALTYVVYKGIPYAKPPLGNLRWREPQAMDRKWIGIRNATNFGPICVQMMQNSNGVGEEDCLYLNIWTTMSRSPTGKDKSTKSKLMPVYVWIHGGMYGVGHGSDPRFDGLELAKKGLTVVTINYRLGMFGFMAHAELNAESGHNSSGMYGILDQIVALKWVKENIANFGGDPNRVTIGGQSAGAGSVHQLLLSPLAKGLFHGAIAESGITDPRDPDTVALPISYRNMSDAIQHTHNFMDGKGLTTFGQLREMSVAELMNGTTVLEPGPAAIATGVATLPVWQPVLDGYVMARTYFETLKRGMQIDVPIITGTTKDEFGATPFDNGTTLIKYREWAKAHFGQMYGQFWKLYNASTDAEAGAQRNIEQRASTRTATLEWTRLYQKNAKSPVYRFSWTRTPPGDEALGAHHSADIQYFFNSLDATPNVNWTNKDRQIAEIVSSYVANFVKSGNPNNGTNGLLPAVWPATQPKIEDVMLLGDSFQVISPFASADSIAFFRRFLASQQKPY